jgi:hypothetical protein
MIVQPFWILVREGFNKNNPLEYSTLVSRPPHTPKIEVFTFLDELEAFEHLLIYC